MPERRATRGEARLAPAERPALGGNGLLEIPAAATILVRRRDELAVSLLPRARGQRGRPHRLRLGPDEAIAAIAFELAPAAAVDQPIILPALARSEEHTSELQSLMRISYAVFCLKKKKINT